MFFIGSRERGREGGGNRNIDQLLHARTLTWDQTRDPSVHGMAVQPLSSTSQGSHRPSGQGTTLPLGLPGPSSRSEARCHTVMSISGCGSLKRLSSCLRLYFSFQMSRLELWFLANILHELAFCPFPLSSYSSLRVNHLVFL